MSIREQLNYEIDKLDERYLELLLKIVYQFPHVAEQAEKNQRSKKILDILHDISDSGGLGVSDPAAWQRDIRQDNELRFRAH